MSTQHSLGWPEKDFWEFLRGIALIDTNDVGRPDHCRRHSSLGLGIPDCAGVEEGLKVSTLVSLCCRSLLLTVDTSSSCVDFPVRTTLDAEPNKPPLPLIALVWCFTAAENEDTVKMSLTNVALWKDLPLSRTWPALCLSMPVIYHGQAGRPTGNSLSLNFLMKNKPFVSGHHYFFISIQRRSSPWFSLSTTSTLPEWPSWNFSSS